jgi:hypothetical protein
MKLYIKKIFNSLIFRKIRNEINYRPPVIDFGKVKSSATLSDSFPWRTDSGFKTYFRFINNLKLFYNINDAEIELLFYSKKGELIKKININNLTLSNEFVISKEFLGIKDFGIFNVFYKLNNLDTKESIIILEKSYVGFSRNNFNPSFVHGNIPIKGKDLLEEKNFSDFFYKSFLINKTYQIQNNFLESDSLELFFANPLNSRIIFYLNKEKFFLENNSCRLVTLDKHFLKNSNGFIKIKSNCSFLRPYIFNYKEKFFDCFHS